MDATIERIETTIERIEATIERMEKESARDRREWNRRWGELANKLGTIVEDIVAPNLPRIARDYYGFETIEDFMLRRTVLNKRDPSREREFDAILVGKTAAGEGRVIINETKSTARTDYVEDFVAVLAEIEDYFPEYQGKAIIPIFASLAISEHVVSYLTKRRIYAMAMGEETMTLLNFQAIERTRQP
jgi:hypothetical protein